MLQNLTEKYGDYEEEDSNYGDEFKMNVYNSLMHNLMNAERVK